MRVFLYSLIAMAPACAYASCADHWLTDTSDAAARAFCEFVDEANAGRIVTVLKKPECPRDGPSSKCNPSSIILPDGEVRAFLSMDPSGGYASFIIGRKIDGAWVGADQGGAVLEHIRQSGLLDDPGLFLDSSDDRLQGIDVDWQIADPDALGQNREFQERIRLSAPWVQRSMERGKTVFFVIQED